MDTGRKRFAFAAGALLLVVIVVVILHARRAPLPVPALTIGYAPFAVELPESGVVQYPQIQIISSEISGNVGHIYVKSGDRVARGTLLATLENPQILSNAQSSAAAYRSASARAESVEVTGGSNVVQAEANLETARARLAQAQQDVANGLQSGLGYGETTAADQRAQADANLESAQTSLREARRIYFAYRDLYAQKAVSRDQLDTAQAKYEQAEAAETQARSARTALYAQLSRSKTVLQDNLRSAQEGYAQAQAQLAAARVESGAGDVAAAQAEAARAGSEYELAREQADATRIRAPYDAIVLSVATEKNDPLRPLEPGDAVELGQPLLTLAAERSFVVRTRIDEQDVFAVRLGDRARITGEDFPGRTLRGHVVELAPIAQRSGDAFAAPRTVAATIAIDGPAAGLRDGMTADVEVLTTDLRRAIVDPVDAIVRSATGATFVYAVENGVARLRPVRVGEVNERSALIESGLRPGDVVVSQDVAGLTDGEAVTVASVRAEARR